MYRFSLVTLVMYSLTSCGPDDCSDLSFLVNKILEDQEADWLDRRDERQACERDCDDDFDACLEIIDGGLIIDTADPDFVPEPLPTEQECQDRMDECYTACPQEDDLAKTFPYDTGDYPLISWTGGNITLFSVRIDYAKGLDDFYWSIKCKDESNCLESPVSFKPLATNETVNASELEEEEPFLSLNDRVVYTISAGRSLGDGKGCAVKKELEAPFEYIQGKRYRFD